MSSSPSARRDLLLSFGALALVGLAAGAVILRLEPPEPVGLQAPPSGFSAERAAQHLALFGNEPHALGTAANERVRLQLETALRQLGFTPEVQAAFACTPSGSCGHVQNVVARRAGRAST